MHDTRYPSLSGLLQPKSSLAIAPPLARTDRLIALSLTLIALAVYLRTLSPSLSFLSIDSNELATLPPVLGVVHASYPLYTWLGFLFSHLLPFGDMAHRINLMSAVLGAASIGGLYLISIRLLSSEMLPLIYQRSAAATGALLFAFSRTFWSQAVIAELYAPNMALIALTLSVLLRWDHTQSHWDFFFFALTFGLSLGTHLPNLGFAPGLVLFVVLTVAGSSERPAGSAWMRPGILAGAGLAGFGLGAIQFILWPPRSGALGIGTLLQDLPTTLPNLYRHVQLVFSEFRQAFSLMPPSDRLMIYADWLRIQFGLIRIALGVVGQVFLVIRRPWPSMTSMRVCGNISLKARL